MDKRYSEKNGVAALVMCILVGYLGIHRFYAGKIGTGIIWLLTAGIGGIGVVADIFLIVLDRFTDGRGNIISLKKDSAAAAYEPQTDYQYTEYTECTEAAEPVFEEVKAEKRTESEQVPAENVKVLRRAADVCGDDDMKNCFLDMERSVFMIEKKLSESGSEDVEVRKFADEYLPQMMDTVRKYVQGSAAAEDERELKDALPAWSRAVRNVENKLYS